MPFCYRHLTLIAVLGAVALSGSACGRRGALETSDVSARPRPAAASTGLGLSSAASDPDAVRDGDELDPATLAGTATPDGPVKTSRGARRAYTIPKQPFFLDPLL